MENQKIQANQHKRRKYSITVHRDVHDPKEIEKWLEFEKYKLNTDYNFKCLKEVVLYFFDDCDKAFSFMCRWGTAAK